MSGIAILKLQRAGFTEQQVEALAEYHEAGAATKSDIADLGHKLDRIRSDIEIKLSGLDRKIDATRSDLEGKIDATRSDLEGKLSELDSKLDRTRSDLELAIEKVRQDLGLAIDRVRQDLELKIAEGKIETIKWVVGVGFAQVAMILAVLRLFPSVHP